MKKKLLSVILAASMALSLAACGGGNSGETNPAAPAEADSEADASAETETSEATNEEKPETDTIVWAQGNSGNVLVSIAKEFGYFEELGLNVEEVPLDEGQLEAVRTGQVDIASNSGTWTPLQMIGSGDDMAVIGGFMLTGCMPVVAREDQEWNGPEDFLGSKMADTKSRYALFHDLVDEGHNLDEEIEFYEYGSDSDEIQAVLKGEIDYATIGTGRMYEVLNTEGIKIVTYCSDVTPNYSCCRMVARDSWVKENPTTVKLLNEALIRAMCYFESHREECVDLMAEQLAADKEYVEAYMLNEHYRINPDTVKNIVLDNYDYMMKVGGIENPDESVNIEDRIYNDIYKEALDAAVEKWGDEDPEFYENALAFYEENNE
ncbi:MAG: ABC transporter substrate-binding protein [Candidatus Avilachnospira sp.]